VVLVHAGEVLGKEENVHRRVARRGRRGFRRGGGVGLVPLCLQCWSLCVLVEVYFVVCFAAWTGSGMWDVGCGMGRSELHPER